MDFDDFECILFQKWDTNGSQNPFRNWIRKGMPLENDFYDIVVDFGPQNGTQNLLKSYLKTDPKKDTQRMPSWCHPCGGWGRRAGDGEAGILAPPKGDFSRKGRQHSTQCTEHRAAQCTEQEHCRTPIHAKRAERGGGYDCI